MTTNPNAGYAGARSVPVDDDPFLLMIEAHTPVELAPWLAEHRQQLAEDLIRHGAVLCRGFAVPDADAFSLAARTFSPDLLD